MKITSKDFQAAKKEVKKVGLADVSKAHRVAIEALTARCPEANIELITDMGWQVVMSIR